MSYAAGTSSSNSSSMLARRLSTCESCLVRKYSLCAGMPDDDLGTLASITTSQRLAAGDSILDEGEPGDHIISITSGTAKLFKLLPDGRRQVTGFLFPGDFAGLAVDGSYIYSAEAVTEVSLCRFPRRQLLGLLDRFPQLEKRLLQMTSMELALAQDQMVLLGRKTASEKVASFLLTLSRRGARPGDAGHLALPMTRTDIADYLGLTTETVSRTFTQLRKIGCIAFSDATAAQILDHGTLERLANGAG